MLTCKIPKNEFNNELSIEIYNLFMDVAKDLLDIVQATEDNDWKADIDILTKCFICHFKHKKSRDILVLNNSKLIDSNEKIKKAISSVNYCIDDLKNKCSLYLKSVVIESVLIKMKN